MGDIGGSSRGGSRRQVGVEGDVAAGVDVAGVRGWRSSKETRCGGARVARVKVGVSRQGPAVDRTGAVRSDDVDGVAAFSGVVVSSLIVIVSLRTPVSCQSTVDLYFETAGISHIRRLNCKDRKRSLSASPIIYLSWRTFIMASTPSPIPVLAQLCNG